MAYLEELLPEFRKGAKIRIKDWGKGEYICIKDDIVVDENGVYLNEFYKGYLTSDEWELYQEKINWQYIIDNGCLCWFWDEHDKDNRRIGLLTKIFISGSCNHRLDYLMNSRVWYGHCRPVRRDEVTFYEEREDEL